jgi:hypothetical protein
MSNITDDVLAALGDMTPDQARMFLQALADAAKDRGGGQPAPVSNTVDSAFQAEQQARQEWEAVGARLRRKPNYQWTAQDHREYNAARERHNDAINAAHQAQVEASRPARKEPDLAAIEDIDRQLAKMRSKPAYQVNQSEYKALTEKRGRLLNGEDVGVSDE